MSSSGRLPRVELSPSRPAPANEAEHEQVVKMRRDIFGEDAARTSRPPARSRPTPAPRPAATSAASASDRVARVVEVSRAILRLVDEDLHGVEEDGPGIEEDVR